MHSRLPIRAASLAVILILTACNKDDNTPSPERCYRMALSDFPYAATSEAYNSSFALVEQNTDMLMMHFDNGIPWQEALDGTAYPTDFQNDLNLKISKIPETHSTYLAITPINFERNALATNTGGEPLVAPWSQYAFDHPDVIAAYLNHCKRMINRFNPDYFAYAIEVNFIAGTAPNKWSGLVNLLKETYTGLKTDYPQLPIFFTIQIDYFYSNRDEQQQRIEDILPYTDMIAVSTYPFTEQPDPDKLSDSFFADIARLAPDKPFAIAETAWPAETVDSPYPVTIQTDEERQYRYMNFLLNNAQSLNAKFVSWFFVIDYDQLWTDIMQNQPNASLLRLWRDCGLYNGSLQPRKAQKTWNDRLKQKLNTM